MYMYMYGGVFGCRRTQLQVDTASIRVHECHRGIGHGGRAAVGRHLLNRRRGDGEVAAIDS